MAQRNIDFGSFPDDPDADAIRAAFQKTQENFSELFQLQNSQGVLSINRTKQPGISVNNSTGNVLLSADFSRLNITTTTLEVGLAPNTLGYATSVNNAIQTLYIDLRPDTYISNSLYVGTANVAPNVYIANGNVNATNTITANNIVGNISVNVPNVNATFVNVSNTVYTYNLSATGYASLTTANVSANLSAGNANLGNLATANFVNVANTVNVASNVNVTDTMQAGNVRTDNLLYANGLPWDLQEPAGSNYDVQFNIDNNFAASSDFKFNPTTSNLDIAGNVNANIVSANTVNVSGTATAAYFVGDGGGLSNIQGNISSLNNGSSNVVVEANSNVTVSVAGQANRLTVHTTGIIVEGGVQTNDISGVGGSVTINGNAVPVPAKTVIKPICKLVLEPLALETVSDTS